jgi:AraC-like DNA-binding protein
MGHFEPRKASVVKSSKLLQSIVAICGFADQSHLTRVFTPRSRYQPRPVVPGQWRLTGPVTFEERKPWTTGQKTHCIGRI